MRIAALYDIHGNLPALESAAERIRRTAYPGADEFAERHVLHPVSEAEALEAFGPAAAG